ncbi:CU044_2847 family protein [Actinomadura parmotrematis]|uniref:Trypsin-co-occurring domain-containing protein n=1 Tax=Actinomadura parmotrematis TaxID=2864039 RepID=A0ABS7G3N4_9ACTN|nr:CU044_2847 family protein [Actinomadura parmotrematis]MBW8487307.1 hypothetical protein [Actinomadura parmotrematis]
MAEVVRYELDDDTAVAFEFDPPEGFLPAGTDEIVERVRVAVDPAVRAAQEVLEQLRRVSPDEVEVKFGVKVSGKANWMIAKASTEANFEIKMLWRQGPHASLPPAEEVEEAEAEESGDAEGS